jgi:hypothetical protein
MIIRSRTSTAAALLSATAPGCAALLLLRGVGSQRRGVA